MKQGLKLMNNKEHRAFCIYVTQHLTLQEMAANKDAFGLPGYHTLKAWSRKHDWKARRKEFYEMEEEAEKLEAQLEILMKSINSVYFMASNKLTRRILSKEDIALGDLDNNSR